MSGRFRNDAARKSAFKNKIRDKMLLTINVNMIPVWISFFILIVFIELLFRTLLSSLVPLQLYSHNKHFGMDWHKPNLDVILKTSEYNVRFRTNSIGLRDNRELNNIPLYPSEPYNLNSMDILSLNNAKNFLYIINTDLFGSKEDFLNSIRNSSYDLFIIDLYFSGTDQLFNSEVNSLKIKSIGGSRLVIAYMSIGEAEDYRYYWNEEWIDDPPSWLAEKNQYWPGNYKVKYWESDWQDIIYGNIDSYLFKILNAGFDGVYLDLIDTYEYFENGPGRN